jgi:hypothetical protein
MASIIAKSSDGKIWKNTSGKIIKAKVFSEDVIQNGLVFWGRADANLLTLVDGLVSEAYDVRETNFTSPTYGKFIQNTVTYRGLYNAFGYIDFSDATTSYKALTKTNSINIKSLFVVFRVKTPGNISRIGIGGGAVESRLGGYNSALLTYNINSTSTSPFYINNEYKTASVSSTSYPNFVIMHSIADFNYSSNLVVGNVYPYGNGGYLKEFGYYNRVLSTFEIIYNINALNAKYSIF